MKKIVLLISLLSLVVFADVGKITAIKGEVFVQRGTKQIEATVGYILEQKDTVITKENSKALLLFNDQTSITVGKNAKLSVERFVHNEKQAKQNQAEIRFGNGLFRTITGKIGKLNKEKFKIKTSTASIGIRGTVFVTDVGIDRLKVGVEDGGIFVTPIDPDIPVLEVAKGEVLFFNLQTKQIEVTPLSEWKEAQVEKEESQELQEEAHNQTIPQEEDKEDSQEEKESTKLQENKNQESKLLKTKTKIQLKEDGELAVEIQSDSKSDAIEMNLELEEVSEDISSITTENIEVKELAQVVETVVQSASEASEDIIQENTQDEIEDIIQNPNSAPYFLNGSWNIEIDEGAIANFVLQGEDEDGDTLVYSIQSEPSNGSVSIDSQTGELVYTPNSNYTGTDSFWVIVSDGNGNSVDAQVTVNIIGTVYNPTQEIPDISSAIEEITGELLPQDNLEYVDYGYVVEIANEISTAYDTYITGVITPDEVIENYITQQATASYSGGISALVDGQHSNGTLNLSIDFGAQSLSGNLQIDQGNWNATINDGVVVPSGFSTTNISGSSDYGDISSGNVIGNFYGDDAQNIGGVFNLNTQTNSAKGVFGGEKQ